jgi:hypothetical protein
LVDLLSRLSRSPAQVKSTLVPTGLGNEPTLPSPRKRLKAHRRLSRLQSAELVSRYEAGELVAELAQAFGIHRTTVIACLRRDGVPRYSGWTENTTAEARAPYESGHTIAEISERMKRSKTTIARHLRSDGVQMRPRGGNTRR